MALLVLCRLLLASRGLALVVTRSANGSADSSDDQDASSKPWYLAASQFHFPKLIAEDVGGPGFLPLLKNSSAHFVLMDFYAPWCPHCQHFAPELERLALAIRAGGAGILAGTMDCVRYSSACAAWGVHGYPTVLWGRREDWIAFAEGRSPERGLEEIDAFPRTAESVASWIHNSSGIQLDVSHTSRTDIAQLLSAERGRAAAPHSATAMTGAGEAPRANPWDAQLALALNLHYTLSKHTFSRTHEDGARKAFVDFVALAARRFPETSQANQSESCRGSLRSLETNLRSNWNNLAQEKRDPFPLPWDEPNKDAVWIDPERLEANWQLCGLTWSKYRRGFSSCRGTWPGKRGYTCGLWTMFHMLAARTEDKSAFLDLQVVRSAIANFFDCNECREHFMAMPLVETEIVSRSAAQLWWWKTHNAVNERVRKLEEQYQDGDPGFPKVQWPSPAECPDCRLKPQAVLERNTRASTTANTTLEQEVTAQGWAVDRVLAFLDAYYGDAGQVIV